MRKKAGRKKRKAEKDGEEVAGKRKNGRNARKKPREAVRE